MKCFFMNKRDHTKKYYNAFRFIVTTGSILLPAILSMGQMDPNKLPKNLIWLVIGLPDHFITCNCK